MGAWTGSAVCVCVDQHGQRPPAGIVREFPVSPSETIRAALIAALAVRFGKSLILLPHLGVASVRCTVENYPTILVFVLQLPLPYKCQNANVGYGCRSE